MTPCVLVCLFLQNKGKMWKPFCRQLNQICSPIILQRLINNINTTTVSIRSITQRQLMEDKRKDKLITLRNSIMEIFETRQTLDNIRTELDNRNVFYNKSNFEFVLLSAFDLNLFQENETSWKMNRKMFDSIVNYIEQSNTVNANLIATVRFCSFLGNYSKFLSENHLKLIQDVAQRCADDNHLITPISFDILKALSISSADNCKLAISILPKFLKKHDLKFKIHSLDILLDSIIKNQLIFDLLPFLQSYHQHCSMSLQQTSKLFKLISVSKMNSKQIMDYIRYLSKLYALVNIAEKKIVVDILKEKLNYQNITVAQLTKQGFCSCCGEQLSQLSTDDYCLLRSKFRSIIFDKNEMYLIKNLSEFEIQLLDFEQFIDYTEDNSIKSKADFDLIIDGLNLAYQTSASIMEDRKGLRNYTKVYKMKDIDGKFVKIFEENKLEILFENILIMGRAHMEGWPQLNRLLKDLNRKTKRIKSFFLFNRTRDDNYILFSAIQHPETKILSNDFFRDHKEKFTDWYLCANDETIPHLGKLFHRWLNSRIIRVRNGVLQMPDQFDNKIHLHQNQSGHQTMHIPFVINEDSYNGNHKIEWICVQYR